MTLSSLFSSGRRALQLCRRGLPALLLCAAALPAAAQTDGFVVDDIRIEGLRRFSPGVVFNRLPVEVGDTLSAEQAVEIIQILYATGYFREVEVLRDGGVLVIQVEENPTIAEVKISGAAELSEDALADMLESAGIAKSKVFSQSTADQAAQAIENAYVDRNFFNARAEVVVSPLPRNRVAVLFNVEEGAAAAIRSISIAGNEAFSTWRLRRDMQLAPRGLLNYFTDSYRYSEQQLQADLARLRTRYLEAGYLRFAVESRQVEISPDKRHIDILLRIAEGERYTVSGSRFAAADGAPALPVAAEELQQYVLQAPGDTYSGRLAGDTAQAVRAHLGDLGYANARAAIETNINDADASVEVVYAVELGEAVYVRRINIVGNETTADEVIRRELLQFEAERYSRRKVQRSLSRVRRLGYFDNVRIDTLPVEGSAAQVDLLVSVEEANTGEVRFGAGFATDGGLSYNAGFSNRNIFGSGNDFTADFSKSEDALEIDFELNERYHTSEGVTRHTGLSYDKSDATSDSAAYSIDGYKVEYGYDFPFTDDGIYNLYLAYQQVEVKSVTATYKPFTDRHGKKFDAALLESGLVYDTRDSARLPTAGQRIDVRAQAALPVLELRYYSLSYRHDYYRALPQLPTEPVLHARLGWGVGDAYGGGEYPFYRRFLLGGVNTLRGFAANSVGYTSIGGDAVGGKARLHMSLEASSALELFGQQNIYLVPFMDMGTVGKELGLGSGMKDKWGSLRSSAGLELRWLSPVGPLRFIYAVPLSDEPTDKTKKFQFSISSF